MNENETFETPETTDENPSFAKEIGKSIALSAAATAGTFVAMAVIGHAVSFVEKRREAKRIKKTAELLDTPEDTQE